MIGKVKLIGSGYDPSKPKATGPLSDDRPTFVIIDDIDAPERANVCQLIEGVGYCYMVRDAKRMPFDGMSGVFATPLEHFGFSIEDDGKIVQFTRTAAGCAKYDDGKPRRWQDRIFTDYFELPMLMRAMVRKRRKSCVVRQSLGSYLFQGGCLDVPIHY